jgi:hypothetical protein
MEQKYTQCFTSTQNPTIQHILFKSVPQFDAVFPYSLQFGKERRLGQRHGLQSAL